MATTTNYLNDLASMRQFIRSLTFGNHNRGKATVRGIKESQHDDVIRRLDYFDIIRHIYTQRIGKTSIHHLAKDDKFEDLSADLDMPDELMDIKFETTDEPGLGATQFVAADSEDEPEEAEDKFELDFDGSIEDIKHQIDEIDKMDELSENLDTDDEPLDAKFETTNELDADEFVDIDSADEQEVPQNLEQAKDDNKFAIEETEEQEDIFADMDMKSDEPDEQEVQVKNSALGYEFLLDDMDVAGEVEKEDFASEENLTQDVLDNELADDIFAVEEQGETEINLEQEAQEISGSEAMQNEPEIAQELDPSEYGDIEQISEKDMALALNESGFASGEAVNLSSQKAQTTSKINELKAQISDAVAKNRDLMGATNPKEAKPGTIRADFAESIDANAVHGSDSLENAKNEIAFFFATREIC